MNITQKLATRNINQLSDISNDILNDDLTLIPLPTDTEFLENYNSFSGFSKLGKLYKQFIDIPYSNRKLGFLIAVEVEIEYDSRK